MAPCVALIFDLDGTLCDTETIYSEAESVLLAEHGVVMAPEDISRQYAGIPLETYLPDLVRDGTPLASLLARKDELMDEVVARRGIEPIPGMPEVVMAAAEARAPLFIASSSGRAWIERCLNAPFTVGNETHTYAEFVGTMYVSGTEVAHPKPAPDILHEAQRRMRDAYSLPDESDIRWVLIGDSRADMACARSAGMEARILGDHDAPPDGDAVQVFPTVAGLSASVLDILRASHTPLLH